MKIKDEAKEVIERIVTQEAINSVLTGENYIAKWTKAAFVRAVKTFAQTAVATIGTSVAMSDVNWMLVVSASFLASIVSLLTSLTGLPEVDMSLLIDSIDESTISCSSSYSDESDENNQE